jgi:hypothetical protein
VRSLTPWKKVTPADLADLLRNGLTKGFSCQPAPQGELRIVAPTGDEFEVRIRKKPSPKALQSLKTLQKTP